MKIEISQMRVGERRVATVDWSAVPRVNEAVHVVGAGGFYVSGAVADVRWYDDLVQVTVHKWEPPLKWEPPR